MCAAFAVFCGWHSKAIICSRGTAESTNITMTKEMNRCSEIFPLERVERREQWENGQPYECKVKNAHYWDGAQGKHVPSPYRCLNFWQCFLDTWALKEV